MGRKQIFWAGIILFCLNQCFYLFIFFLLKKKQFFNIFFAGIKIKWAGIKKKSGLELNILLKICIFKSFFNIFSAGIKKKVGWNYFFLLKISLFKFFVFFCLKNATF